MTSYVLGVDLGTSYSAGAFGTDAGVDVLEVDGDRRIPSTVVLTEQDTLLAGVLAERSVARAPERAERNPKRYVGHRPMLLGGTPVAADQALAATLALFVEEARRRFDRQDPARLVLTHPVAWSDAQRAVLADAAARVLPDVELLRTSEPNAAAWHFAHDRALPPGQRVAVYDLGGGTFDAVVLTATADGFEPAGRPTGDPDIGGEAFDRRVLMFLGQQLEAAAGAWWNQVRTDTSRQSRAAALNLLSEARRLKEALSRYETASQWLSAPDVEVHIDQRELEDLITQDVQRTLKLLAEALDSSGGTGPDLAGIYVTGGASRTVLVERLLRDTYKDLVRIGQHPKLAVPFGAARLGLVTARAPEKKDPEKKDEEKKDEEKPREEPEPQRPTPPGQPRERVLGEAQEARIAAGTVYTLAQSTSSPAVLRRLDPRDGRVLREVSMARVVAWEASDFGLVVVERRGDVVLLHTATPDLTGWRSEQITARHDPTVVVDGGAAWVVFRSHTTVPVDQSMGMPWGEVGELTARTFVLDTRFEAVSTWVDLGPADYWYLDEDGASRRLLDFASPTSVVPAPVGDGVGVVLVQGRHDRSAFSGLFGRKQRSPLAKPHQLARGLRPDGALSTLATLSDGTGVAWVHQVLVHGPRHQWFLTLSSGLLMCQGGPESERQTFAPRPSSGAARWLVAGETVFGVTMGSVLPNRDASLHVLAGGKRRDLGKWHGLLGNLASVRLDERPRSVVAGDALLLGVALDETRSGIVRADRERAAVVAESPGWCAPVGTADGSLIALRNRQHPPGDRAPLFSEVIRLG